MAGFKNFKLIQLFITLAILFLVQFIFSKALWMALSEKDNDQN